MHQVFLLLYIVLGEPSEGGKIVGLPDPSKTLLARWTLDKEQEVFQFEIVYIFFHCR